MKHSHIIRILSLVTAVIICLTAMSSCSFRRKKPGGTPDATKAEYVKPEVIYSVNADGTASVEGFQGELTDVVIQRIYHGCPVVSISNRAFYKCRTMTSVTIPDTVTSIGRYAFGECSALSTVTLPENIAAINGHAFTGTPWVETLKDEFVIVGDGVLLMYNGNDTVINVPDNVKFISMAFAYSEAKITEVNIPSSVTAIGDYGLANLRFIETFTLPDSITSIGDFAFFNCTTATSITIPDSVTSVGAKAFMNCRALTSVNLPQSITKYSDGMFTNCTALTTFTVHDQITSIGNNVFQLCTNLKELHIHSGVTEIGTNVFIGVPEDIKIYGAEGSKAHTYAKEYGMTFVAE